MVDEFLNLPKPVAIESTDSATIIARNLDAFKLLAPEYESFLDSDPAVKVLQQVSAGEKFILDSLNSVYERTFVQFATGSDLDLMASKETLTRLVIQEGDTSVFPEIEEILETDEALRRRIFLAIQAKNYNSDAYYALKALGVVGVKDVYVISEDPGEVSVYILATAGSGVPGSPLLDAVEAAITAEAVRDNTLVLNVLPITLKNVSVYANVYLTPTADITVFNNLETDYTSQFAAYRKIGLDFPVSQSYRFLMKDGVHRVELFSDALRTVPLATVTANANEIVNLVTIDTVFSGREY
jgi:phage-related baseplate assembly protein